MWSNRILIECKYYSSAESDLNAALIWFWIAYTFLWLNHEQIELIKSIKYDGRLIVQFIVIFRQRGRRSIVWEEKPIGEDQRKN